MDETIFSFFNRGVRRVAKGGGVCVSQIRNSVMFSPLQR